MSTSASDMPMGSKTPRQGPTRPLLFDVVDPRLGHLGDDAQVEAVGIGMVE